MDNISNIRREIGRIMFERPSDVSIRVGSLDTFERAVETAIGKNLVNPHPKKMLNIAFGGVQIIESSNVPANMAVILHGNEIINIVNFQ